MRSTRAATILPRLRGRCRTSEASETEGGNQDAFPLPPRYARHLPRKRGRKEGRQVPDHLDSLSALAWLVEAGADEAIGDAPVNRFQAKANRESNPPPEGGSKSVTRSGADFGEGSRQPAAKNYPSPKTPSPFSTLP